MGALPPVLNLHQVERPAVAAERMEIRVAEPAPADEADAELSEPWVRHRNSSSSMPSIWLNWRMGGIVASPTPMVPISSDSTA
jgi:hypothetical protein